MEAEGFIIDDTQVIYEEIQKRKKEDEENKKQQDKKDDKPVTSSDPNDYMYFCSPITYRVLP